MKTAIVTDSNSGIFPQEGEKLGIYVMPMPVILDGQEYFEGVDLNHSEFYQKLQDGADASTSQPAPGDVMAMWEKVLGEGYDEIVYIPMSSGLSNSCSTAKGLAEEFDGKVQVVDNHRISVTLRDAVMDARALAQQGLSAGEIRKKLEESGPKSLIYLGVETLKFFKKNGRCTAATAALGTVLNIKPLLKCDGERFDTVAKVRGVGNCKKKLLEAVQAGVEELEQDGPVSVAAAGSFAEESEAEEWLNMVREAFPEREVYYDPLSFSISCHTGPNAFGAAVSRIER